MNEIKFRFWQKWLLWANLGGFSVGILVAFAGNTFIFDLHNQGTQQTFFYGEEITPEVISLKNWLFGIIGGTIAGFHLLAVFIIKYAFLKKEKWAWNALLTGLLLWFIIDSGVSIQYEAFYNVYMINLPALVFMGLPLITTRRYFYK